MLMSPNLQLYIQLLQKEYKCIKCIKQHAFKNCPSRNRLDKPIYRECKDGYQTYITASTQAKPVDALISS
ncbi:hypothetical protein V1477_019462 [Vespula maculifrons]|uniref:Uncharacterized protein n=1 Tax=Vespula maculifrons TaxID=7453 RepID=A0ABD2ASP3_VESMC